MTSCRISSVDDRLGSSSGRFFGEGYKGVSRRLTDIKVVPGDHGRGEIHGTADLRYSSQWSTKGSQTPLRPHLSTPDGLLFAVNLVEAYLVHAYRLSAEDRRQMWVAELSFQAGSRPQEDLVGFDVSAKHESIRPAPGSGLGFRSAFRCRIGALRINCVIEHGELIGDLRPAYFSDADDILGPPTFRHYGVGFRSQQLNIGEIDLDPESETIRACVGGVEERWGAEGLEGGYPLSMSMLDAMVALVQLAQVLIYEVDQLERSRSNTLWMRRAMLSRRTPNQALGDCGIATVGIEATRTLKLGGQTWRTFDVAGEFGDFRATSALAHQLPAGAR